MYLIHGVTTLFALALMYVHKLLLPSDGWIKTTGDWAFNLFLGLIVYSMVFLAGWLTSRSHLLMWLKKKLEQVFKHELTMWIHRLNLVATLLVFVHVLLIDYVMAVPIFGFLLVLYTILTFASYIWYQIKWNYYQNHAHLLGIRQLTGNIYELTIQLGTKNPLSIQAGDFVYIHFPTIKGLGEPHPFSIINAPSDEGTITLAIRGEGDFTRKLQKIKHRVPVEVTGGYGLLQEMIKGTSKADPLVLVGGGIGVVPLFSLVEGNANRRITFLYSVKEQDELLYQEKFFEWEQNRNIRFVAQKGRFSQKEFEKSLPTQWKKAFYIIGGPVKMNRQHEAILLEMGVSKNQIYYESFNW